MGAGKSNAATGNKKGARLRIQHLVLFVRSFFIAFDLELFELCPVHKVEPQAGLCFRTQARPYRGT